MSLVVHHLNLCTMCPLGGRLISGGERSIFDRGEMVAHSLLVETKQDGLVLVDTGFGLDDVREAKRRLHRSFLALAQPRLSEETTAVRQVERLGFSARDVRHIVVTHLDVDHAGGLSDFPEATVHVHRREHVAAMAPLTWRERQRYSRPQLDPVTRWQLHEEGGDDWFGLTGLKVIADDVVLVPLPGHTRGHSAVAVRSGSSKGPEWLLHCGDAYFFHLEVEAAASCPPLLRTFQARMAVDDVGRRANAERLRTLHRERSGEVRLFSAHCPHDYRALAATAA